MITVSDFPDLTNNILVEWNKKPDEFQLVRDQLANVVTGSMARVTDHSKMSSVQTARRRTDGGNSYKTTLKQGYRVTMTKAEIAEELDVTHQMRLFDKYGEIMAAARSLRDGVQRRIETDLAAFLYNAWSTSYTNLDGETVATVGPDGLALMSSSHTANGSSNTYSNQIDATHDPIDPDVLERLVAVGNGFITESDGRLLPTTFDTIVTGRHAPTVFSVQRILNSTMYPGSSLNSTNNATNVLQASYKHLVVPFLDMNPQTEVLDSTRARYTFLANLGNKDRNGFLMEFALDPMLDTSFQVTESGVWQYPALANYALGLIASNFIVGTKGDGTVVS